MSTIINLLIITYFGVFSINQLFSYTLNKKIETTVYIATWSLTNIIWDIFLIIRGNLNSKGNWLHVVNTLNLVSLTNYETSAVSRTSLRLLKTQPFLLRVFGTVWSSSFYELFWKSSQPYCPFDLFYILSVVSSGNKSMKINDGSCKKTLIWWRSDLNLKKQGVIYNVAPWMKFLVRDKLWKPSCNTGLVFRRPCKAF